MKGNSIEEDIARIAKLITTKFNNDYSIDNKDKEAIEHILSAYKRVLKENEKLKNIRYDTPYGTETIHLITESDLIEINTQKYMIEVEPGKFVDLKQVYLENEELKNLIAHKNAYTKMLEKDLFENCSNYVISRQKIKDKIEYLEDYIEKNSDEQGYWGNINPDVIYEQIEILKEILKESEE